MLRKMKLDAPLTAIPPPQSLASLFKIIVSVILTF